MLEIPKTPIIAEISMLTGKGEIVVVRVYDNPTYYKFYYWFMKVNVVWKITSRIIGLDKIEAEYNQRSAYTEADRIVRRQINYYPNKNRYLELMAIPPAELGANAPLPVYKDYEKSSYSMLSGKLVLTAQDRDTVDAFHRRERRKIGLSK